MITIYLLVAGVIIGLVFYGYTKTLRSSNDGSGWKTDTGSTGMTSGPVNQTRAIGAAPKVMPVNIRIGDEDKKDTC